MINGVQEAFAPKARKNDRLGGILLLTGAHLINDAYPNLYPVLIPTLMLTMHFNVVQAGLITTVAALTTQLLQPFMGLLADRMGGRWFVSGGLALGALLSTTALGFAPNYYMLLILLLLSGVGNSAFHPHASSIVGEMTKQRKGLGMSLFLIGGNLGRGLAPLMAGLVFVALGRPGLLCLSLPGLALALIMNEYGKRIQIKPQKGSGNVWATMRANKAKVISLLGVVGIRSLVGGAMLTFLPIFWHMKYGQLTDTAFLLSTMLLVGSVGNFLGGYFSDLVGEIPVLIVSALLSCLFLWLFLHVGGGFWVWVLIGLLGAALFSTASVTMVLGQKIFPRNKGMASGIALGVGNTMGSAGVGLIGLYAQRWGIINAFYLLIPLSLISIPFVFGFRGMAEGK